MGYGERTLAAADDVVEFGLPIEKSDDPHTQIQICRGKGSAWETTCTGSRRN
jgi:hypothetical protein